uniref:Ladinin 1 n=1 Tax=Serinus canaria TaxID=9135 RepID=A0A8C9MVV2_SERCA
MSFSRRNWSDLSSLARQRTLEDEEEQQRERRRRHRSLLSSTSTDEKPASPAKDISPASSRPSSLVKPQSPENGEERKLSEVLKTQEGRRTRGLPPVSEKLRQEKEQKEPGAGESCQETEAQPRGRQESSRAAEHAQEAARGRGDPPRDKNLEPGSERKVVVRTWLQDKDQGAQTPRGEQRKEAKEPPEVGSCRLREVKILTRVGNRSTEEKISAVTSSPEQQIISKKQKEESQSPLTRSASLRIPGSNSTIGEKLEKYNSAVQRSEGVKSSVPAQKSRLLSSEGVASKRNFFERSAPSKAEPAALRKEIRRINSLAKRDVWIKQPGDTSGDTKVIMELLWNLVHHLWQSQDVRGGVIWGSQDSVTLGSQQEGTTGGICKGEEDSGLGGEGKWPVMGFRGCLPAPSPAGDSHCLVKAAASGGVAASGTASVVPTFFCSCSNTSCAIRPSGKNWFAPKIKAQPYPTIQQPLPRVPCAMCGCSPRHGVLCLWDGKEEAWKSLPVPSVPNHCLSVEVQACRLPTDAEGQLLPCLPSTFAVLLLISACAPELPWQRGSPTQLPGSWRMSVRQEPAWLREFQLHIHGPRLLPGAGGAVSCHPCQAVTARGAQPEAHEAT